MKQLRSMASVYKVLGGIDGIAAITGSRPKQVWWWQHYTEKFPAHSYVAITRELNRLGYEASASLWAMKGRGLKRAA